MFLDNPPLGVAYCRMLQLMTSLADTAADRQEAGKELLIYGVGDDALVPLKKQYINFGDSTIHSMILHL